MPNPIRLSHSLSTTILCPHRCFAILEDAGFRVLEAATGDDAKIVSATHADAIVLLFSDVEMPGATNGFALPRHVAETYPSIQIVIASGHAKPQAGDMPEKATFIGKPFSAEMVHHHLRSKLPHEKKPEPLKQSR